MTILSPTKRNINKASTVLKEGGLVAFATETVYGLGCDTFNIDAIKLVYKTKGRPINNPMIAHILEPEWSTQLTDEWDERCKNLAATFWPGSLTIVLPKKETVPSAACGGRETIAIRCPQHPVARNLLSVFNQPISAPSANKSGYISPTTAQHVEDEYGGLLLVIDGGPCKEGIESTVLSLVETPSILRRGTIPVCELESVVGTVLQPKHLGQNDSPGTAKQHYSPHTTTSLISTQEINTLDDRAATALVLSGRPEQIKTCIQMPQNQKEYGAKLYDALRAADNQNPSHIFIEHPPTTQEWLTIQDRLVRCTAKRIN